MRIIWRSLTALTAAAMVVLMTAAPASAHDELLSSSPAPGERLEVVPTEVALTFSADVLTIGAAMIVVDASGRDWITAEPTVTASTVTATLDAAMPVAGYEIRWRVVSSDGHPISGIIPFTVGDAEPLVRTDANEQAEQAEQPERAEEEQSAQENQDTSAGLPRVVLIGAGGAVVAIAAFVLIHLFLRRRKAHS